MKNKYFNDLTPKEILSETIVYDNGGETYDRYTIFTPDGSVFGMSEDAKGFNQFLGDHSEIEEGDHLGKKLKGVPKAIQYAVLERMEDEEDSYGDGGSIAKGNYQMILSQAKEVKHHANELQNILKNEKDIDAWVVAKMENVSSTLSDITHYLDGKTEYGDGGEVDDDDLIEDDDNEYANGGSLEDMRKKYELNRMMVRSKVALAIGIDDAIMYQDQDFVVSPYTLLEGAVNKGFIEAQEIDKDLWESALSEAYSIDDMYRDSGQGIGGSDMNAFISSMLNDAGIKIEVVNNRYERVGGKFAKGGAVGEEKYYYFEVSYSHAPRNRQQLAERTWRGVWAKSEKEAISEVKKSIRAEYKYERPPHVFGKIYPKLLSVSTLKEYVAEEKRKFDEQQERMNPKEFAKGGEVDESELRFQKENKLLESVDKDYVIVMYNTKTKKNEILTSPDTFKTQRYRYTSLMNKGKLVGFQKIKIVQLQDLDFTYEYNGELFAKGGEVETEMSYKEMNDYEKSNHIHYNPMNSRWEVTKNGKSKEFWNQEQAEKYAEFEFNIDLDSRYSRSKYKYLFAKGGEVESTIDILMTEEPKVWDKFGFNSGSEIRASKDKTKKYAQELERVFTAKGIKKGSLTKKINEDLTDENYHLLNEFLTRNGYFNSKLTDELLKSYNNPVYSGAYADKESITIDAKAKPNPSGAKKIQRKKLSAKTTYISNREIEEIDLKSGKKIAGSDIVDGVYKKK